MNNLLRHYGFSLGFTAICFAIAAWYGWASTGSITATLGILWIVLVLSILEISLSFDNAVVNATVLRDMDPVWQRRFLTWGILIAVFGMRILFPLLVVVIAAGIGPWAAIKLAALDPRQYGEIMKGAQTSISAFGGCFLMMVALRYFFDQEKEVDWIKGLERRLRGWASLRGIEIAIVLGIAMVFSVALEDSKGAEFIFAAAGGLLTFLIVELLGQVLDQSVQTTQMAARGGLGAFLYLEVLDASFSFDGVIGAFALTQNLFLIGIGLGIGAMYVRSMTIMLVEKGTLAEFKYLENGAFWSILTLSVIMFAQAMIEVPEYITGLLGAGFIGLSLWSSLRARRKAETPAQGRGAKV